MILQVFLQKYFFNPAKNVQFFAVQGMVIFSQREEQSLEQGCSEQLRFVRPCGKCLTKNCGGYNYCKNSRDLNEERSDRIGA